MKTIAITGATGVVGARTLVHLLGHDDVGRVVALGRRAPAMQHEKLASRVIDLQSVEAMAAAIPADVSIAICSLGTTRKAAGSKEAFRAIDRDAVLAFGQAALQQGARRFVLVSSIGADAHSRNFYLRTKGEAEAGLALLGYEQLTVVRPSFIDDQGARKESRLGERLGLPLARAVFGVVGRTHRYAPITADTIGRAVAELALDETREPVRIVESDRLHVLGN